MILLVANQLPGRLIRQIRGIAGLGVHGYAVSADVSTDEYELIELIGRLEFYRGQAASAR